jgi:hypothetical protein
VSVNASEESTGVITLISGKKVEQNFNKCNILALIHMQKQILTQLLK